MWALAEVSPVQLSFIFLYNNATLAQSSVSKIQAFVVGIQARALLIYLFFSFSLLRGAALCFFPLWLPAEHVSRDVCGVPDVVVLYFWELCVLNEP